MKWLLPFVAPGILFLFNLTEQMGATENHDLLFLVFSLLLLLAPCGPLLFVSNKAATEQHDGPPPGFSLMMMVMMMNVQDDPFWIFGKRPSTKLP